MGDIKINKEADFQYTMNSDKGDYKLMLKIHNKVKGKDDNPWFSTIRLKPNKPNSKNHQMHLSRTALKDLMLFVTQLAGQANTILGDDDGKK